MMGRKKLKKEEKKVQIRVFVKRKHHDLVLESILKTIAKYEENTADEGI